MPRNRASLERSAVPVLLLLSLLLGGSTQGVWRVMVLQLLAIGVIGWATLTRPHVEVTAPSRALFRLIVLVLLLFVLQLVLLPPSIWTELPGRTVAARGFTTLRFELPWSPWSLTPYATLATALTLLVPIAVVLSTLRHGAHEKLIAVALIAGTLLGIMLGTLQSLGGKSLPSARWYLYDFTNPGAVGFFANSNHMGTLLLTVIPFVMALISSRTSNGGRRRTGQGLAGFGAVALLLILVGIALNGSLAAVLLALPVLAFSALILPRSWAKRRLIVAAATVLTIIAVLAFTSSPIQSQLAGNDTTSWDSRLAIWSVASRAVADSFPLGTGLGSFEQVYRLYEDIAAVTPTYVNHAHNDYLELVVEAGLPAILLISGFLVWWVVQVSKIWRSPLSSHFARAATIASAAVLAHSLVDYPLRTAAIAAVFGVCLGLMVDTDRHRRSQTAGSAGAKHLVIG